MHLLTMHLLTMHLLDSIEEKQAAQRQSSFDPKENPKDKP